MVSCWPIFSCKEGFIRATVYLYFDVCTEGFVWRSNVKPFGSYFSVPAHYYDWATLRVIAIIITTEALGEVD
jgi:hypothetical protein